MTEPLGSITIFEVTSENVDSISPFLLQELDAADFIAIDQELSGLGNTIGRGRLEVSSYYTKLREAAETRRVVSLGIAVFKSRKNAPKPHPDSCDPLVFSCLNFNILLMPDGDFELDGSARRFLVTHGFDLNRWVELGIIYSPRGGKRDFMESVVRKLLTTKASIVFHNGLTDLAYFYQSFYSVLPKNNQTFTADVADMFGARLFDTKFICNKVLGWRIHSLEYCFKKSQRITEKAQFQGKPAVHLHSGTLPLETPDLTTIPIGIKKTEFSSPPKVGVNVCELVYHFGFCNAFKTDACLHSVERHQMDLVLDVEEQKNAIEVVDGAENGQATPVPPPDQSTSAKERLESDNFRNSLFRPPIPTQTPFPTPESPVPVEGPLKSVFNYIPRPKRVAPLQKPFSTQPVHPQRRGTGHFTIDNSKTYNVEFGLHSAGFDAFMTGYVYAVCLVQLGRQTVEGKVIFKDCDNFAGRVHMTGKSDCYSFVKSVHVKTSAKHAEKMARIRADQP